MARLLLVLMLCAAAAVQAAQSVEPAVFKALDAAQRAQQQGDHGAARRALDSVSGQPGSLEQALLWRSRGYLAWAEGRHADAIDWLDKALASGRLQAEVATAERLNLARLCLQAGRHARVVELLAPQQAAADGDSLQLLVQAYQGLGQSEQALPLAERYLQANPRAGDEWLQFVVAAHAELKRFEAAERWQRRLLARQPDHLERWQQLAALQQLAGQPGKALASLRTTHGKGLRFSAGELDRLVLLASAAQQPWQGASLLAGLLDAGLLARTPERQERLARLWWQARERAAAAPIYRELAKRSGQAQHWLSLAQLELERRRWRAGLAALAQAERAGAEPARVRAWRDWAQRELAFEQQDLASSR